MSALLLVLPGALCAQDTTTTPRAEWVVGGSVSVPRSNGETAPEFSLLSVQWTQLRPNRLSVDMAIGTMPRALIEGFAAFGIRGGVALPMILSPNVILLPAGGVSAIVSASGSGSGGTVGLHYGVTAVLRTGKHVGIRSGIMLHRFGDSGDGTIALFEIGIVRIP